MLAPSEQPSGSSTTAEAAPTQSVAAAAVATTTTIAPAAGQQQVGDQLEDVTSSSSDQAAGEIGLEVEKESGVKDEGHREDETIQEREKDVAVVAAFVQKEEEGEDEEEEEEEESKCESDSCESSTSAEELVDQEVEQGGGEQVEKKEEKENVEVLGESETETESEGKEEGDDEGDEEEEERQVVGQEEISGLRDQVEQLIDLLSQNGNTQAHSDKVIENMDENGIVRATFVDFVMEEEVQEEEEDDDEDDDEEEDSEKEEDEREESDGMMMMTGNPDLQKIRAEQVRKWLIFEQDSANSVGSSLSESMEVDSLAVAATASSTDASHALLNGDELLNLSNGVVMDQGEGQDQDNPRRVRFLTDQEGNLLISVFMTNTPTVTTPLSEEPSSLSNGVTGEEPGIIPGGGEEGVSTSMQHPNPSLVVSPPSLDNSVGGNQEEEEEDEEELVDSIEPSAPPLEETAPTSDAEEEDEEEPASIVLVVHPEKEPPREKPPAPPTGQQQEDNDSSDETLSVSSCNSMIEIMPSNSGEEKSGNNNNNNNNPGPMDDNNNNNLHFDIGNKTMDLTIMGNAGSVPMATPCFQLGIPTAAEEMSGVSSSSIASSSPQPASLIIHELEEHNEGLANQNGCIMPQQVVVVEGRKVPTVDENNNIVEDSVLEEGDLDEEEPMGGDPEDVPQFNPEIGEQVKMPDLRRSTSSSDGEVDDEGQGGHIAKQPQMNIMQQRQQQQQQQQQLHQQQQQLRHQFLGVPGQGIDDDQDQQMVSLCIQEEHISAVALTIAKWESMTKAQSTENLSCPPQTLSGPYPPNNNNNNGGSHAPVTKCSSSPCPKSSSPQQLQRLLSSPGGVQGSQGKPIQPVAPLHQQQQKENVVSSPPLAPPKPQSSQVNRVVIHGTNSNPISTDVKIVAKAAGWQCWGNKLKDVVNGTSISGGGDGGNSTNWGEQGGNNEEIIYAQPNPQAGSTMTSITNPSAILKAYPKPLSKGEIINWLREGEIHRAGLMLNYAQSHHHVVPLVQSHQAAASNISPVLVTWFFGLISRQQAEKYLHGQPPGTFLVRISTRIWGYTLSYQAISGRTKHFLISAVNPAVPATLETGPVHASLPPQTGKQQRMSPFVPQGRYAFIGTNMTPYGTLVSLIRHHSHAPITKLGGEKLLNPCPGGPQVAGMEQLFQKSSSTTTAQPVTSPSSSTSTNFIIPSCS